VLAYVARFHTCLMGIECLLTVHGIDYMFSKALNNFHCTGVVAKHQDETLLAPWGQVLSSVSPLDTVIVGFRLRLYWLADS
jgi:hypothetical protein